MGSLGERGGLERGALLLEALFLVLLLSVLAALVVPAALRAYEAAAVEYEAEGLLAELRYQQRLARTTARREALVGTEISASRPGIFIKNEGYQRLRGTSLVLSHENLPRVRFRVSGSGASDGEMEAHFADNGTSWAGAFSIRVYAEGKASHYHKIVVDSAGRIRMELSGG